MGFVLCIVLVQRLRAALAMVMQGLCVPTGAREKAINPSLSGLIPTGHQRRKIRNLPPTRRSKRKMQINTWGGINRKTLAVNF